AKYEGESEVIVECPLYRLPLFVKSGAIIPMQPVVSNTSQSVDLFIVHLYSGEADNSFFYHDDDGASFAYQSGIYAQRMLRYEAQARRFVFERVDGTYTSAWKSIRLVFHGFQPLNTVEINDKSVDVHSGVNSFFAGLEKYD